MIIWNSSSTGTTTSYQFPDPTTRIAVQPTGACTFSLQGSIGGAWTEIVASSTYAGTGAITTYSTGFTTSRVRAVISAVGSTSFALHMVGS